jgi:hypothetical protein
MTLKLNTMFSTTSYFRLILIWHDEYMKEIMMDEYEYNILRV